MDELAVTIWNAGGSAFLSRRGHLPSVGVHRSDLLNAKALREAVRTQIGAESFPLHVSPKLGALEVELVGRPPLDHEWQDATLVRSPAGPEPWQQPGWLTRTFADASTVLSTLELHPTGDFEIVRTTNISGIVRIGTAAGSIYLKTAIARFHREGSITRLIGDALGSNGPSVVAIDKHWWLAEEFPRPAPSSSSTVLDTLLAAQRWSLKHTAGLAAAGVETVTIGDLIQALRAAASREDLLGSTAIALGGVVERAAEMLFELETASTHLHTLVHGDLNPGNFFETEHGAFIFDWTDAALMHPFVDLAVVPETAFESATRARFLQAWRRRMSASEYRTSLEFATLLGSAFQTRTYLALVDSVRATGGDEENLGALLKFWATSATMAADGQTPLRIEDSVAGAAQ